MTVLHLLKVLRKLNAFVVFATQSVEDATKSSISDTLEQQTATQIYLPNLKATEVYKTASVLASAGVKGLWNFSNAEIVCPADKNIVIENVHLGDSLMALCYEVAQKKEEL